MPEQESLFDWIDPHLPSAKMAKQVRQSIQYALENSPDHLLTPQHIDQIRNLAETGQPVMRAEAVIGLLDNIEVSIADLEKWLNDPDKDVRESVLASDFFEEHLKADPEHFISLLLKSAERYADFQIGFLFRELAEKDDWLDHIWQAAETLIDQDNAELNTMLLVAFFEHVIEDESMMPTDPHLKRWLDGHDSKRQAMMLYLVDYHKGKGVFGPIGQALGK